jgi:hypothetical protein
MNRDPVEYAVFVIGLFVTGLLSAYCKKYNFSVNKSFWYGFIFGVSWLGAVFLSSFVFPQYISVGDSGELIVFGILIFSLSSGAWCAYETGRSENS